MRIFIIMAFLFVTACVGQNEVSNKIRAACSSAKINITNPIFSQHVSEEEVGAYYSCLATVAQPSGAPIIGQRGSPARNIFNREDDAKRAIASAAAYQLVLWQQVLNHNKSPAQAQEAWMLWQQQERQMEASENSSRIAAYNALNASNRNYAQPLHCTRDLMGGMNCN